MCNKALQSEIQRTLIDTDSVKYEKIISEHAPNNGNYIQVTIKKDSITEREWKGYCGDSKNQTLENAHKKWMKKVAIWTGSKKPLYKDYNYDFMSFFYDYLLYSGLVGRADIKDTIEDYDDYGYERTIAINGVCANIEIREGKGVDSYNGIIALSCKFNSRRGELFRIEPKDSLRFRSSYHGVNNTFCSEGIAVNPYKEDDFIAAIKGVMHYLDADNKLYRRIEIERFEDEVGSERGHVVFCNGNSRNEFIIPDNEFHLGGDVRNDYSGLRTTQKNNFKRYYSYLENEFSISSNPECIVKWFGV